MTYTNVTVSVICSNFNCEHFVLASVLVHNQLAETEGANTTSFRFWRPISLDGYRQFWRSSASPLLWLLYAILVLAQWVTPFCTFLPACVTGGQPCRQGHQPVQPLAGRPVQEFHRLVFRRAAAHRQLPSAQDHRQGKLCQGQAGSPHPDGQGGETGGSGGPGWEGDGGLRKTDVCQIGKGNSQLIATSADCYRSFRWDLVRCWVCNIILFCIFLKM